MVQSKAPDDLNDRLLKLLADWPEEWMSADLAQRMLKDKPFDRDPSIMLVARRLSKLATEGQAHRKPGNGNWLYKHKERVDEPHQS